MSTEAARAIRDLAIDESIPLEFRAATLIRMLYSIAPSQLNWFVWKIAAAADDRDLTDLVNRMAISRSEERVAIAKQVVSLYANLQETHEQASPALTYTVLIADLVSRIDGELRENQ
jgi:hypothetical protein